MLFVYEGYLMMSMDINFVMIYKIYWVSLEYQPYGEVVRCPLWFEITGW